MRSETWKSDGRKTWLSGIFLALAVAVCALTVRTCCPQAVAAAKKWLGFGEGGRAQAAFLALEDTLASGGGVAEAFASSRQAIFDAP